MNVKQVTIFGGTGLIGGFILKMILNDNYFQKVIVVTRSFVSQKHNKMEIRQIDFSNSKEIERSVENSSIVFSSIGTTQSQVKGDKKAYRKIDFQITHNIALACKLKQVEKFLFVSSAGADSSSSNFYMNLKGEIDDVVSNLELDSTIIFRPSLLLGKRNKFRFGEKIAQILIPLFSFLMPKKLRPVQARKVAKLMIELSKLNQKGNRIVANEELILRD
jgi:uncharacterized protein YbjT (DUF2867 family)